MSQGHPQLQSKFKASLYSSRPCLSPSGCLAKKDNDLSLIENPQKGQGSLLTQLLESNSDSNKTMLLEQYNGEVKLVN